MAQSNLFIGISGSVLAIDRATGQEIWRAKLKGSDFVNVALEDGALYAATHGELFCLDPTTGQVRWHNQLKGLGFGLISMAPSQDEQAVLMKRKRQQEAQAAAAGTAAS